MMSDIAGKFTIYAVSMNGMYASPEDMADAFKNIEDLVVKAYVDHSFEIGYEYFEDSALNFRDSTREDCENAMNDLEAFGKQAMRKRAMELAAELESLVPSTGRFNLLEEIDEELG
jgi:hypothetical protein